MDAWQRLWGMITPWQTAKEKEAGMAGTWGSGEYQQGSDVWENPGGARLYPDAGPDVPEIFRQANVDAAAAVDPLREQLTGLQGQIDTLPGFTDWMNSQGLSQGDTSGLQGMIEGVGNRLADTDTMTAEGQEYAAQMAGFGSFAEMQQWLEAQREAGFGENAYENAQGLGAQELAMMEKQTRRNTADMERRAQRMLGDTYSESGSMAQLFAQSDQYLNSIADAEVKMQNQTANMNRDMKMQQVKSAQEGWATQVQQGTMTASQYMGNTTAALNSAWQAYSVEMDAIFRQNEQMLDQYNADYNAIIQQIQLTFAAMETELGLTMSEYEIASTAAMQALAPYYTALELESLAAELTFDFSDVAGIITAVAEILAML